MRDSVVYRQTIYNMSDNGYMASARSYKAWVPPFLVPIEDDFGGVYSHDDETGEDVLLYVDNDESREYVLSDKFSDVVIERDAFIRSSIRRVIVPECYNSVRLVKCKSMCDMLEVYTESETTRIECDEDSIYSIFTPKSAHIADMAGDYSRIETNILAYARGYFANADAYSEDMRRIYGDTMRTYLYPLLRRASANITDAYTFESALRLEYAIPLDEWKREDFDERYTTLTASEQYDIFVTQLMLSDSMTCQHLLDLIDMNVIEEYFTLTLTLVARRLGKDAALDLISRVHEGVVFDASAFTRRVWHSEDFRAHEGMSPVFEGTPVGAYNVLLYERAMNKSAVLKVDELLTVLDALKGKAEECEDNAYILSLDIIERCTPVMVRAFKEHGYLLTPALERDITSGDISDVIVKISESRDLLTKVILAKDDGLMMRVSAGYLDYRVFSEQDSAMMMLENVDLDSVDKNIALDKLVRCCNDEVMQCAISHGILRDQNVDRHVATANSLDKIDIATLLLTNSEHDDLLDDFSLDDEEEEDITDLWDYWITGGGVKLMKYKACTDIVEIPSEIGGLPVHSIDKKFLVGTIGENCVSPEDVVKVIYMSKPNDVMLEANKQKKLINMMKAIGGATEDAVIATALPARQCNIGDGTPYFGFVNLENIQCNITDVHKAGEWICVRDKKDKVTAVYYLGRGEHIDIGSQTSSYIDSIHPRAFKNIEAAELRIDALDIVSTLDVHDVRKVVIGSSNAKIPSGMLANSSIEELVIEEGVTTIGNGAFRDATSLERVVLPSTLREIGEEAFSGCANLKDITLNEGLETIDAEAFVGCVSLKEITIPGSVEHLGMRTFAETGLEIVTVEDGVRVLPYGTFKSCKSLNVVTLPSEMDSIEPGAFAECRALHDIILPRMDSINPIGVFANSEIRVQAVNAVRLDSDMGRMASSKSVDSMVELFVPCKASEYNQHMYRVNIRHIVE